MKRNKVAKALVEWFDVERKGKHKNEPLLAVLEIELVELLSLGVLNQKILNKLEALKKQIERIKNGY